MGVLNPLVCVWGGGGGGGQIPITLVPELSVVLCKMSKSVPVTLVLHAEARLKATTEGKRAINTCHEITLFFGTARHAFTWFCTIFA